MCAKRGPKPKDPKIRKAGPLGVRFSPSDIDEIKTLAANAKMPVSQWVRQKLLGGKHK